MFVSPDHENLIYCGRIDFSDPKAPVMLFPCSYVRFRFRGTGVKATVANRREYATSYLGCLIDGQMSKVKLAEEGTVTVTLAEHLPDTEHEVMLYKRMDACHIMTFLGVELSQGAVLCRPPEEPERRIEVYGDSVSAGEVSEAVDCVGQPDPPHDGQYSNSYYSYSWITARKLNARIHDIAQGGAALLNGTGWFHAPDYIGMEQIFDKLQYNPRLGEIKEWDFSLYRPQVVIVALGQNDGNPEDYMAADYQGEKAKHWRMRYGNFLKKLRTIYPDATIIAATTILNHDPSWDRAIEQVCRESGDDRLHHFLYRNNGRGTPGHIRIPEAEGMAEELSGFITSLGEGIWR